MITNDKKHIIMEPKKVVTELIKEFGGSQSAFSKMIGVKQPTVAAWLAQNKLPLSGKMRIIQRFPEVNRDFLDGNSNQMLLPTRQSAEPMELPGAPFYLNLPATAGRLDVGDYDGSTERISIPGISADAFLPVKGMSMSPTLESGDVVGIRAVSNIGSLRPNGIYMLITTDNERMIKRIREIDRGESLTLYSDNPDYPPFQVLKEQVSGVWRVVCFIRSLE